MHHCESSTIKKFYHGFCQFWVQQLCLDLASSHLRTVFSTSKYLIQSVVIFSTIVTTTSQENNISFAKKSQSPPPSQPSPSVLARFRILAQGRDLHEAPCWQSFKCDGYVIFSVYEVFIIVKREHSKE